MAAQTIAEIDRDIPILVARLKEAEAKGDLAEVAQHQEWIDMLLDCRSFRKRNDLP